MGQSVLNLDALYPRVKLDPNMVVQPIDWLIDGVWQRGKINGVFGFEKSGKSRLVGWLLVGLHRGGVVGCSSGAAPPRILYLCGEESRATVNQRIVQYAGLQGVSPATIDIEFIEASAMRLDLSGYRHWLESVLLKERFTLVVGDPLRRLHAADEDKSSELVGLNNDIRRWSNNSNITFVLVHHTPKIGLDTNMDRIASWARGSSDIAAIVDTAQYVDRLDNQVGKAKVLVRRAGRFAPLPHLELTDLGTSAVDKGFERGFPK